MTTDPLHRVLLRSLPALLQVLLALLTAPAAAQAGSVVTPEPAAAEGVPADSAAVLVAQFTAGVRGSRAPPAASV